MILWSFLVSDKDFSSGGDVNKAGGNSKEIIILV
jgi:hypothetical protein